MRPVFRSGEIFEAVPGVVISQHSGEGKANQYYVRGFNIDHGTDLSSWVAGAPVNMPTHAHGQGYSDNNFLIPELVSGVQYQKGTYSAEEGDFSAAGAVNVNYLSVLDRRIAKVEGGPDLHTHGNIVDHEYTIERDGDKVAEVSKRWFRVRDTYGVEVFPGENDVLILAIVAVIDTMAHPDR